MTLVNRRQFLVGAGAAAALGTLAACGGNASPAAAPAGPTATGANRYRGLTLTYLVDPFYAADLATVAKEWSAETGAQVTQRKSPDAVTTDRLTRLTAQDSDLDLLSLTSGENAATYYSLGLLEPLDGAVDMRDDLWPDQRVTCFFDGKQYAVPYGNVPQALYYDIDIVSRYGIKPPQSTSDAWTMDEAIDAWRTIQAGERARRRTDQYWACYFGFLGLLGFSYHGLQFPRSAASSRESPAFAGVSEDGLTASGYLNHPEAVQGLQVYQDLYRPDRLGLFPLSTNTSIMPQGKAAFWWAIPFSAGDIQKAGVVKRIGATPVPYVRTNMMITGYSALAVSSRSRNKAAALDFARFFSTRGVEYIASKNGTIPARQSYVSRVPQLSKPPQSVFLEALKENGVSVVRTPGYSDFESVVNRMLADIANGSPVQGSADAAAAKLDGLLKRYRPLPAP